MTFLRLLGKFLISVGVGVLLFVAYTLWGTGFYTDQQQDRLKEEYAQLPVVEDDPTDDKPPGPPDSFAPGPGDAAFEMRIPKIWGDKSWVVVEGVDVEDLKKGPGHYPRCRPGFDLPLCTEFPATWPGQQGRVVVSGHRTTYDAPFWDLQELRAGDAIVTDTKWGRFTYRVTESKIVEPDSQIVVIPSEDAEIVLTTCNPRFSADQRLVVYAELEEAA